MRSLHPSSRCCVLPPPETSKFWKKIKEKEKRAYEVCLQKIEKHKLDMNLTEVEYAFDGSKILFYLPADACGL